MNLSSVVVDSWLRFLPDLSLYRDAGARLAAAVRSQADPGGTRPTPDSSVQDTLSLPKTLGISNHLY